MLLHELKIFLDFDRSTLLSCEFSFSSRISREQLLIPNNTFCYRVMIAIIRDSSDFGIIIFVDSEIQ